MKEADIQKALIQLRAITNSTGTLHGLQIRQLQVWPRLVVPNSTDATAEVEFPKKEIRFSVQAKGKKQKGQAARYRWLAQAVKFLLGDEWRIAVSVNGKPAYASERGRPISKVFTGTDFSAGLMEPAQPWNFQSSIATEPVQHVQRKAWQPPTKRTS